MSRRAGKPRRSPRGGSCWRRWPAARRSSGSISSTSGARPLRSEPIAALAAGVVTPLGPDLDAFWSGLLGGGHALTAIERFATDDLRVGRGGEIKKIPAVAGGIR